MSTLLVAIASFVGFIVAYHTYGRWLARKIFNLDPKAIAPSEELRDDVDFVPTKKNIIFGHHFTSIAGTGPIVGPAIAVFWGWLPALLWVVFGSIFIGAVHDLGALVVSMRNRGQTVGEVAGRLISPRARVLFLLILFFALTVVLAIFGLVIALIFRMYPESVVSVWIAMPVAVVVGWWVYKRGGNIVLPSILALGILYGAIVVGVYWLKIEFTPTMSGGEPVENLVDFTVQGKAWLTGLPLLNPVIAWTAILMVYCFFASVLPVWLLLQPRDFINSHQLVVALVLLVVGLGVAGLMGSAELTDSTPAIVAQSNLPAHSPPIFPFLFITIACGACSGFHCLVSSGTTSKQVAKEPDAQYVAYGSMLLEGALAVLVILACTAGVGMGKFTRGSDGLWTAAVSPTTGQAMVGHEAWVSRYNPGGDWNDFKLAQTVGAFVDGGANFLSSIGLPLELAVGVIATLVACFAATTLDTATRLQRYVIQELAGTFKIAPLTNKFLATGLAVGLAMAIAMMKSPDGGPGSGGLILWPLFGATNQLLAGLAFMVTVFYLWRRNKPVWFIALPMVVMLFMPAAALLWQMFAFDLGPGGRITFPLTGPGWIFSSSPLEKYLLTGIGAVTLALQIWMVIEGLLIWRKTRGVLEEALPPLRPKPKAKLEPAMASEAS
jgi:carbon starvation protein